MKSEIKIPAVGESVTEATVSAVLAESGSSVKTDQEILEIETEKVNQVLYAPAAGLLELTVKPGDVVKIGQVIGSVDTDKKGEASAPKEKPSGEPEKAEGAKVEPSKEPPKEEEPKKETLPSETKERGEESVRKTTDAFVKEMQKPVLKEPSPTVEKPPAAEKKTNEKREERVPMSKIRKTIARRLVESKQSMALLTTFNEVDMSAVSALRKKHKEAFLKEHNVRLGFMSFFLKASVSALQAFPQVNAYLDRDDIVFRKYYDINVAISTEKGLVVPVIADCDRMSFAQIEQKIVELSDKAKDGRLTMDEMRSGGFTVSNGGVFGSTFSTPIVNPPQSAILGMHRIVERPCAVDGQVVIRPIMILALSYDHRIIDGREAVSFLAHIVKAIEDPSCLLIDL